MADWYQNITIGLDGVENTVNLRRVGTTPPSPVSVSIEAILDYKDIGDPRAILRPSLLTLQLTVDQNVDIDDLFTELSKQWEVELYRDTIGGTPTQDSELLFYGWLQPDTIQEDFVSHVYTVTLRCTDGLDELKNEDYSDQNGDFFTGPVSLREIIFRVLRRTGLVKEVRFLKTTINNDLFPVQYYFDENATVEQCYFDQLLDQRTFIRGGGGGRPESCEKVLTSLLTPANAFICSVGGTFYVMWRLMQGSPVGGGDYYFRVYDPDGVRGFDTLINVPVTLGSRVNGFNPHWAAEDQIIVRRSSLSSAKIFYKYGNLASVLTNSELNNNGSPPITGWTINQGNVTLRDDGTILFGLATTSEQDPALTSDLSPETYQAGGIVQVELSVFAGDSVRDLQPPLNFEWVYRQRIQVTLEGAQTYYLDENRFWTTTERRIPMSLSGAPAGLDFTLVCEQPTPIDGRLRLKIYPVDNNSGVGFYVRDARIDFAKLGWRADTTNDQLVQESNTMYQRANNSPVVYEAKQVLIGPWYGTRWIGSLQRSDGGKTEYGYLSPTGGVPNPGFDLFRIAMRDVLRAESKIAQDFQGSIFGFIPYLSKVTIDGARFAGRRYFIGSYSWNVVTNLTSLLLYEIFYEQTDPVEPNPWYDTLEYLKIVGDTGEEVKPIVRG